MHIHYVYRSTPRENNARRPPYYSKDTALRAFLRAVSACESSGDVIFVNDGPGMPGARLKVMEGAGEVIELPGLGDAGSYRFLLTFPEIRRWAPEDIMYFGEDDYFYLESAFAALVRAAGAIDRASFFTLYDSPDYATLPMHKSFQRAHRNDRWFVDGLEWRAVRSTTNSFGARVRDLREQIWVNFLGSGSFLGDAPHPDDDYIWNASQSIVGRAVIPMLFRCLNPRNGAVVNAKRLALMLQEYRSVRRERLLVAPVPSLATHMHIPLVAPNVDWDREASLLSAQR